MSSRRRGYTADEAAALIIENVEEENNCDDMDDLFSTAKFDEDWQPSDQDNAGLDHGEGESSSAEPSTSGNHEDDFAPSMRQESPTQSPPYKKARRCDGQVS